MPILTTPERAAIAWQQFGDGGDPPLVLIQGFSAQMLGWHPGFCQRLADEGFRVIRFDNRDVGRSQRYAEGGYGMADLADDTAALITGLGLGSAHIVGQSMGGMIAQLLVSNQPGLVRSLGLLYTTTSVRHLIGASEAIEALDASPLTGDEARPTREQYIAGYVEAERNCASPAYPQDVAWLAELGGQMFDAGFHPAGIQHQLECILAYPDRTEADRAITVPTTILAGDGDRLIDFAASLELHGIIPGSTLRIFEGMGHELPRALWGELVGELAGNARLAGAVAQ